MFFIPEGEGNRTNLNFFVFWDFSKRHYSRISACTGSVKKSYFKFIDTNVATLRLGIICCGQARTSELATCKYQAKKAMGASDKEGKLGRKRRRVEHKHIDCDILIANASSCIKLIEKSVQKIFNQVYSMKEYGFFVRFYSSHPNIN